MTRMWRVERGALMVCWRREVVGQIFAGVAPDMRARDRGKSGLVTKYQAT